MKHRHITYREKQLLDHFWPQILAVSSVDHLILGVPNFDPFPLAPIGVRLQLGHTPSNRPVNGESDNNPLESDKY